MNRLHKRLSLIKLRQCGHLWPPKFVPSSPSSRVLRIACSSNSICNSKITQFNKPFVNKLFKGSFLHGSRLFALKLCVSSRTKKRDHFVYNNPSTVYIFLFCDNPTRTLFFLHSARTFVFLT